MKNCLDKTVKELKVSPEYKKIQGRSKLTTKKQICDAIQKGKKSPQKISQRQNFCNMTIKELKSLPEYSQIPGRSKLTTKKQICDAIIKFKAKKEELNIFQAYAYKPKAPIDVQKSPINVNKITRKGKVFTLKGENYITEEILGEGAYGIVLKARKEIDNKFYALKFIKPGGDSEERLDRIFLREKVILEVLKEKTGNCKDFVCYEDAFKAMGQKGNEYVFITDFVEGIELFRFLPKPHDIKIIFKNLIRGYKEIEERGVVHRDIKPENIMINPNTLKITFIDFGLSCLYAPSIHKGLIERTSVPTNRGKKHLTVQDFACFGKFGTPLYFAPEIIAYDKSLKESDIYALAIVFLFVLTGNEYIFDKKLKGNNFYQAVYNDAYNYKLKGTLRIPMKKLLQGVENIKLENMANLLEAMLERDFHKRAKINWIEKNIDKCFTY